jgi:predicted ester cyclase
MTESKALRALREAIVLEHMDCQNEFDFDTSLNTFPHPRYEVMASGQVFDGVDEVRAYWQRTRAAFPDQRNKVIEIHHADDAVAVEFELRGTHLGSLLGEEPTNRTFKVRMAALFLFEKDILVCERVYGDTATVMSQLGLLDAPETY